MVHFVGLKSSKPEVPRVGLALKVLISIPEMGNKQLLVLDLNRIVVMYRSNHKSCLPSISYTYIIGVYDFECKLHLNNIR